MKFYTKLIMLFICYIKKSNLQQAIYTINCVYKKRLNLISVTLPFCTLLNTFILQFIQHGKYIKISILIWFYHLQNDLYRSPLRRGY